MIPRALYDPALFHACVLLNLLFISGAWCIARPTYRAAVALGGVAVAWLIWNHPLEGYVLFEVRPGRGFTESDVLSVLALAVAASTLTRTRDRRRYEED
ncbi:hypothetical protein IA539_22590 [Gordonia sp. zg691]|uniref:hypothetical protein n=1 Tax=Gordonia jinghuaiqii TaxID=2758710 RepID=UPI001662533B|nr:hypothetical protein [Gordonia jinghuaiqii]MBD0863963.1 hypothetical protein [Gordonia jinghuaiqii]